MQNFRKIHYFSPLATETFCAVTEWMISCVNLRIQSEYQKIKKRKTYLDLPNVMNISVTTKV